MVEERGMLGVSLDVQGTYPTCNRPITAASLVSFRKVVRWMYLPEVVEDLQGSM